MEKYRYTGEWPSLEILEKFPNWEYAFDEEEIEGQDETTIKPQENQSEIKSDTNMSAVDVVLPSGENVVGIAFIENMTLDSIDFMFDGQWFKIRKQKDDWMPFYETWLPEADRSPKFSMDDQRFFPMRVTSRLPKQGGEKIFLEIH